MALLDPARGRARLTDGELGAASLLLIDRAHASLASPAAQASLRSLEAGGGLVHGVPVGWLAELLAVVAAPKLRIVVETFRAEQTLVHSAWATETHAVLGSAQADGTIDLGPIETLMLPWAVARVVGLGPRPLPTSSEPLELAAALLDRTFLALAAGDAESADRALRDEGGLDAEVRRTVLRLLLDRRISWRASSVWTKADGERATHTLTVVDAGDSGLWRCHARDEEQADGGQEQVAVLEPVAPSTVWYSIVELVPGTRGLAPPPATVGAPA